MKKENTRVMRTVDAGIPDGGPAEDMMRGTAPAPGGAAGATGRTAATDEALGGQEESGLKDGGPKGGRVAEDGSVGRAVADGGLVERAATDGGPLERRAADDGAAGGSDSGDWRTAAWTTGAADRLVAEAGIREAYRAAGLAEPAVVVWFDSPLTATAAALLLSGNAEAVRAAAVPGADDVFGEAAAVLAARGVGAAGPCVREALRTAPWEAARRRAQEELGPLGWAGHWGLTAGELWEPLQQLTRRIRDAVTDRLAGPEDPAAVASEARTTMRLALLDAMLGQHDAAWLAALADRARDLAGQVRVARAAGWWWPLADCVLACERPVVVHRDEAGRLHHADGPCVAFPDGFALHAWRGMPVPADLSDRLAVLTADAIRDEPNAELRRVMLEHYGYERYLAETGATPLHRDETGVLWRIRMGRDEPVVMVEVVNSTPEPDGSRRVYWLRVPPHTRTAREGVGWTFGLSAEEYDPQRQT